MRISPCVEVGSFPLSPGKVPTFPRESSHVPIPDFLMISNDARRCEPLSKFRHSSHSRIPNFLMMQKGASPSVNLGIGPEPLSDLGHPDFLMMEKVRAPSDLHFFTGSLHPPLHPPLSLYVGSLTPISSHFGVIWRKGGWAKMAAMLFPGCDFKET